MKETKKSPLNHWHALTGEEAVRRLSSDAAAGLSPAEADSRRRKLGQNRLWQVSRTSVSYTLLGEFLDFAAILLVITAAVAAIFERGGEAAAICVLLVLTALARTVTSVIARRIFENAAGEQIPRAVVIRGGRAVSVHAEDVVPGDILLLSAGDTAVCDARILSGEIQVLETALSGEGDVKRKSAEAVLPEKTRCEGRCNTVFASSSVVLGNARAVAVATGEHTYAYARGGYIPVRTEEKIGVIERLCGWCRNVSLCMTAVVVILTVGGLFLARTETPLDSLFLSALALAVASMSEFLSVIAAIILACSMRMLSRSTDGGSGIVHVEAVEKLAHARCVVFASEKLLLSDNLSVGNWYADGKSHVPPSPGKAEAGLLRLLQFTSACSGYGGRSLIAGGDAGVENPLYTLSERLVGMYAGPTSALSATISPAAYAEGGGLQTILLQEKNDILAYVCGSLENVLSCCANVTENGVAVPMSQDRRAAFMAEAVQCESRCVRTVAIAVRSSPYNNLAKLSALHTKMTLLGYYTVLNPVQAALSRYIAKCRSGGIRMVLLTESPDQARYLAGEAGLMGEGDLFVDAASVPTLAEKLRASESGNAVVCVPDRERRAEVLRTLKGDFGDVVYVRSDMADMRAAREATVSLAAFGGERSPGCLLRRSDAFTGRDGRGERGSAPAFEALRAVGYCKNALLNLRGAAEYLLISQVMRLTLISSALILGLPLLSPLRILVWGLALDYAAVLTLAFRRPRLGILEAPLSRMQLPSPGNGMLFFVLCGTLCGLSLAAIVPICRALGLSPEMSTVEYVLYAGGILASFVSCCFCMTAGRREEGVHIHAALLAYTVLCVVVLISHAFAASLSLSASALIPLAASVLPACLVWILFVLYNRTVSERRDGKRISRSL